MTKRNRPYRVHIGKYTYNLNAPDEGNAISEATYMHLASNRRDTLVRRDDGKLIPENPKVQCLSAQ